MKEIKVLIQQLKSYPDHYYVYPQEETSELLAGLRICNKDGEDVDFIRLDGEQGIIVK